MRTNDAKWNKVITQAIVVTVSVDLLGGGVNLTTAVQISKSFSDLSSESQIRAQRSNLPSQHCTKSTHKLQSRPPPHLPSSVLHER